MKTLFSKEKRAILSNIRLIKYTNYSNHESIKVNIDSSYVITQCDKICNLPIKH